MDELKEARGECFACRHKWRPRKLTQRKRVYCPKCGNTATRLWNAKGKMVHEGDVRTNTEHTIDKGSALKTKADSESIYKKDGVWYKDGMPVPELFIEAEAIDKEIDKTIKKSTYIQRSGVSEFPEFDTETVILIVAEAIKAGYRDDYHEFIKRTLQWHEAEKTITKMIQQPIDPEYFPEQFLVLMSKALDARHFERRITELERQIETYDRAREMLNVKLDDNTEELLNDLSEQGNIKDPLLEISNFSQ